MYWWHLYAKLYFSCCYICSYAIKKKKKKIKKKKKKKKKKLTRLNITAMCHIKIKLEMAWKRDDCQSVSIQRDEMKIKLEMAWMGDDCQSVSIQRDEMKIKLEMAWMRDDCQSVSIQRDEMKYLLVCDGVYRAFMRMTRIIWLLKRISEHQFTIKKHFALGVYAPSANIW